MISAIGSETPRRIGNLKALYRIGLAIFVIARLLSYANAQAQQTTDSLGAKILSTTTDGQKCFFTITNVSSKEITAAYISFSLTLQNGGTAKPTWLWDLGAGKLQKNWRSNHHIAPGEGLSNGILHPGEVLQDSLGCSPWKDKPIVQASATVTAVIYADSSAEATDTQALQSLLTSRRNIARELGPLVEPESPPESSSTATRRIKNQFFSKVGFPAIQKIPAFFPQISISTTAISSLPALPISQSDAVIVGNVAARRAFLGQGNTGIYSEIQIKITQVLKGASPSIEVGQTITVQRPGGVAYFQDGSIQLYKVTDQDWPIDRKPYVFFVKNSQLGDFDLLTAYELCGKTVYPLDGATNPSLPFRAYSGMKARDFLDSVRNTISQQGGQ